MTLYWHRRTHHQFLMPGHKPSLNSIPSPPCILARRSRLNWNDKTFELDKGAGHINISIRQRDADAEGEMPSYHEEHLTSIPSRLSLWNPTLLNGDETNPNLRVLLTPQEGGGLAEIKRLRMTWDELMLKFPLQYRS